ncbi:MAG: GNAT family N-acetyltransferase [Bacteroidales bacterium]|nr:GNAT family N-acetyltransferase [Bacteroidales bacterium]
MADITFRKATPSDAAFIARNVLASVDIDTFNGSISGENLATLAGLAEVCAREDTLYSWKNTLIAEVDGIPAGSISSYDGARYRKLKRKTFGLIARRSGYRPGKMDDETCEGEYYLDSMAVLPSFRGHGLGRLMIGQALEIAEALGFATASLIVDVTHHKLRRLYASLGFREDKQVNCFGTDFMHAVLDLH